MNQSAPGAYGDLLYRGSELVVVRSIDKAVVCPDWTADVTPFGHLMFLNAVLDPATQQVYASGKANIGSSVVIVGPDNFQTVIPGGYGNYPSQVANVDGMLVCFVVLNLTQYGVFDLEGTLIQTLSIPAQYQGTSQGIRFIGDDGSVFWGDQTMAGVFEGLVIREWMQRGGYTGGQGQDGGFALSGNGVSTLYPSGLTFFPRIAVKDQQLALLYVNGGTVFWDTLTLPLEPLPPAPDMQPPKIADVEYDAVLKAGETWQTSAIILGTHVTVIKDDLDRLWWATENSLGSDHTGLVRQLTIEGPTPEPEPEPPMLGRYWLQPNIGSLDLIEMFERFEGFDQVDVFVLPIQNVLNDAPNGQIGNNTYPNLVNAHAFTSLKTAQIPFVIEGGAVKGESPTDERCMGAIFVDEMHRACARVRDAGGEVAAFSMDEPITNAAKCNLSLDVLAERTANYIRACHEEGCDCGLLEAYPNVSFDTIARFVDLLEQRGAPLDYIHPDIDHVRAHNEHQDVAHFIAQMQGLCDRYRITLGLFVNSTVDPVQSESQHYQNLQALARTMHGIHPLAAHVHVAAWCRRGNANGPQDIPSNLSQYGLVASLADTVSVFGGIPTPTPEPEIDPMDYKLVDYVLRIKGTKPSSAEGKVTAILPDDKVASIQPDGTFGTRDAGTDGPYEQAYERGNLLLCEPVGGKRYAVAYRVDA